TQPELYLFYFPFFSSSLPSSKNLSPLSHHITSLPLCHWLVDLFINPLNPNKMLSLCHLHSPLVKTLFTAKIYGEYSGSVSFCMP
ncbi:hypothetical protein HID58_041623, partial [Brassica napus]